MSLETVTNSWSADQLDEDGNILIEGNVDIPQLPNYSTDSTAANYAKQDTTGLENTQIIVNFYGASATGVLAVSCYNFSTDGTNSGSWYLPAAGELCTLRTNRARINKTLNLLGKGGLPSNLTSSTEGGGASALATYISDYEYEFAGGWNKPHNRTVHCYLSI